MTEEVESITTIRMKITASFAVTSKDPTFTRERFDKEIVPKLKQSLRQSLERLLQEEINNSKLYSAFNTEGT